jgi:hypothetical protein
MQGDISGSEASSPYHSRADKENAREARCGRQNTKKNPKAGIGRNKAKQSHHPPHHSPEPSSRRSSLSTSKSDRNAPLRNVSSKQNVRPTRLPNEKERRRWKDFQSIHPEVVVAAEKDRRRMNKYQFDRPNRRHDESMSSSASSFSDNESNDLHFVSSRPKYDKPHHSEGYDGDVLGLLMEDGHTPNKLKGTRQHDEVLQWIKDELDRNQHLIKHSKQMHTKELANAKKELEKVKRAAKIIIKAVQKKAEEKAAKLEANIQSERWQRVKSQKMVQSLIKSQSDHLDQLKQVNRPGDERFYPWDGRSEDLFDIMGDSDLTSVLDELAEEAFQQSYCS